MTKVKLIIAAVIAAVISGLTIALAVLGNSAAQEKMKRIQAEKETAIAHQNAAAADAVGKLKADQAAEAMKLAKAQAKANKEANNAKQKIDQTPDTGVTGLLNSKPKP